MRTRFTATLVQAGTALLILATVTATTPAQNGNKPLTLKRGEDTLEVRHGDTPVARYMHAFDLSEREKTYKPFLHVMEPDGEDTITKGPFGKYSHHRGVFRGWGGLEFDGERYDTWHMGGVVQRHLRFLERNGRGGDAAFTSVIRYQKDGGEPLLHERRTMRFRPPPEPAYAMFDVVSTVRATEGKVRLGGDPEHAGLQFRAANNIEEDETYYVFSRPDADPKSEDDDFRWVAMSYVIDGNERYTVLYLNHPDNPGEVNYSAYRSYGRFGAWFPHELEKGESSTTRVRFLIFEGAPPAPAVMHEQYNRFAGTDAPTPETTVRGK